MNAEIRSNIFSAADGMNQSMQQTTFAVAPDFRVRFKNMNNEYKIELPDIQTRRKFIWTIVASIAFACLLLSIYHKEWIMGATFFGSVLFAVLIAVLINHIQGALVSIEMNNDELLFKYAYLFSNKTKCKKFKIHDIKKIEYRDFSTRLSVESDKEKLHINLKDSKKVPIKSLAEVIKNKTKMNERGHR